jgi:integrase/recombinase XerC
MAWSRAMIAVHLPFLPLSARWLADLSCAGHSKATVEAYRFDLLAIGLDLQASLGLSPAIPSLAKIGQAEIDQLNRIWTANGLARSTTLRRFSTLRGVAAAAAREVDCAAILAAVLPLPNRAGIKAASDRDVDQLLNLPVATWTDARDTAVLNVMSETGATSVEVAALDWRHCWKDAARLALASESPAARIASISQAALEAIVAYRDQVPFPLAAASPLFCGQRGGRLDPRAIQVMLSKRSAQAGASVSVTSMMLRHRRGRRLAADGRSPQEVAEALGISAATAVKYFAPRFDHLRHRKIRGRRGRSARLRPAAVPFDATFGVRTLGGRSCS